MKILHATHHFWPCIGGIERAVEDFCIELIKAGCDCKVLCLNRCAHSQKKLPEEEKHAGIEIVRVPFIDLKYYKIALGALKHACDADIIHVHGLGFFSDFFILTKPFHRKPVVISSHGAIFHTGTNLFKNIYFFGWCRLLLKFADRIVAVSENDANIFSKIVPQEKIVVIHNPVRLDRFYCAKKNPNTFAFVGRLSRNKRLDLLIEAFASASRNKEAMLYIVGSDFENLRKGLERKVKNLNAEDRIKFLGALPEQELVELLASTDFFISASEYEGFGISAIEGMVSGCIPVLSSIPSFRAFVEKGKNGFLLDFHNTKEASKKLAQIMELSQAEKEKMRKNAIIYSKRFEPKEQTKKLLALYSELYNKRR